MKRADQELPPYVRKVREDTQRYAQELLAENDRLRVVAAAAESQRARLEERARRVDDVLGEMDLLREYVAMLERDKRRLQDHLADAQVELEEYRSTRDELARQLEEVRRVSDLHAERYAQVEEENANLAHLYAASYRLHRTRDRARVLLAIQEIVADLIGSEELGIYELEPGGDALRLAAAFGIDPSGQEAVPLGAGRIGRAAATGAPDIGPWAEEPGRPAERHLTACIPLKLDDRVTGVLAVFRLQPPKQGFLPVDHALFELLGTHAAAALYCTGLLEKPAS